MRTEQSKKHVERLCMVLNCNNRLFQFAKFMDTLSELPKEKVLPLFIDYLDNSNFFEEEFLEFRKIPNSEFFRSEVNRRYGSITAFMQDNSSATSYADIMVHIIKHLQKENMRHVLISIVDEGLRKKNHLDINDVILGNFSPSRYSPFSPYMQNILPTVNLPAAPTCIELQMYSLSDSTLALYKDIAFILYNSDDYEYCDYHDIISITGKSGLIETWLSCAAYYENFDDRMIAIK